MRIAEIGEFALIERLATLTGPAPAGLITGIGDDTAVIDTGGPRLLLATIDIQVEGRHFLRRRIDAYQLGRRTAAINLSDIGAMGGAPHWALASLALPGELEVEWVERLYRGLSEELNRFGAAVIGGNLSGGQEVVIDLALLGEVERDRVLLRSGARPGDVLLVTGGLGASAAGRFALDQGLDPADPAVAACITAHLTPTPRVREGRALAATGGATALIDLSDGLAGDLRHIAERSGVGVRVDLTLLPISQETRTVAARLGLDPVQLAVAGGEDYELLLAARPEAVSQLRRAVQEETGVALTAIGEVVAETAGMAFVHGGQTLPWEATGWDHFRPM